ncbi:KilA-N domain-containing protein [Capnocytophaga sputigena]
MIRKMGTFDVTQRTKDGFFNATALLKQWNNSVENQQVLNTQNSGYLKNSTENQKVILHTQNSPYLKKKDIDDFFLNKSTQEYIQVIMQKENLNAETSVYLKSRGKYSGGTWMHPMLFIDFAMWLNPSFKYDVLKFVYDEMIKYRNLAGDSYKELCSAVSKLVSKEFIATAMKRVAEALNYIIFGDHKNGIRNDFGEEQKQQELWEFQRKVTALINEGFISTFESLVDYLRNSYKNKHLPKVFN